jgi:predicted O-linked N-acetylglucosamine transferase (SPINDLY family)
MTDIATLPKPSLDEAQAAVARGDFNAAEAIFRALHNPAAANAGLLMAWSRLRRRVGDMDGAMNMLRAASQAGAGGAAALDTASLLLDLGRADQATQFLREAAAAGKGSALDFETARWEAANRRFVRAASIFRGLVKAEPRHLPARLGYARAVRDAGQLAEAETAYTALLNRAPDHAAAMAELAYLYGMERKFGQALALYERLEAAGAEVTRELSQVALGMMHMCDWAQRDAVLGKLASRMSRPEPCILETYALLGGVDDPVLHRQMADRFAGVLRRVSEQRLRPAARQVGPVGQRLRVGYLSGDFNQHATSLLMAGVLAAHDRSQFEIFAYDYSAEDGSATRAKMKTVFEHFRIIEKEGPANAAARIAADGIDILVDLKGYTERTRSEIVALRAAPVQVSFLGYVGTQGGDWIDYIIADETVLPEAEYANWTETPVLMPASYYPNDRGRPVAPTKADRAAQGLPAEGVVFCCFNNPFKISPEIFAVWMGLLRDVAGSALWLFEGNEFIAGNLRAAAAAAGVDPGRLYFARPMALEAHLARHACADLFLDTTPYGAHTTGADALWAGVPMVTYLGRSFASRVGGSLLRAVGLPELVCSSLEEYGELARALAADAPRRAALRDRLIAARDTSSLFDASAFCRGLESAYTTMAARAREGLPPTVIRV